MFNPRGDISASLIEPSTFFHRPNPVIPSYDQRRSIASTLSPPRLKKKPCYDWIFSSGTNVHIAVDRSVFKTYTPFKSYVLAVANQKQIPVRGIGTVELRIRRQPGLKSAHVITLDDVLHVPSWHCNILSDVVFTPAADYEHVWSEFGVNFYHKTPEGAQAWGFTENFCGQDKIVLAMKSTGRSPMLEDKDREVFSISLNWPQGQRDRWILHLAEAARKEPEKHESLILERKAKMISILKADGKVRSVEFNQQGLVQKASGDADEQPRQGLKVIDGNVTMKRGLSVRSSSLKAHTSSWSSLKDAFSRKKGNKKRNGSKESSPGSDFSG